MERKIIFRGFNKKNGVWLYGSYILNRSHHFVAPDEFAIDKTWEDYEVDEESVGQFADMSDSEGRLIYDGDVVEYQRRGEKDTAVVYWNATFKRWMLCTGVGDFDLCDSDFHYKLRVIGTQYGLYHEEARL